MGFLVLDTEGNPNLKQVAVFDSQGKSIYEAHVSDEHASYYASDLVRPLNEILSELKSLMKGNRLVAHNAIYDAQVIRNSFLECGLKNQDFEWECTYELAKDLYPGLETYALGPLCDQLERLVEPGTPLLELCALRCGSGRLWQVRCTIVHPQLTER